MLTNVQAWVYDGSDNVWASLLLEIWKACERTYGAFKFRAMLADLKDDAEKARKEGKSTKEYYVAKKANERELKSKYGFYFGNFEIGRKEYFRGYTEGMLPKLIGDILLVRPILYFFYNLLKRRLRSRGMQIFLGAVIAAVIVAAITFAILVATSTVSIDTTSETAKNFYYAVAGFVVPLVGSAAAVIKRTQDWRNQEPKKILAVPDASSLEKQIGFMNEVRMTIELLVTLVQVRKVVKAGKKHEAKLLLIVDDLDRCKPRTISEVLMCIQMFLVDPGIESGASKKSTTNDNTSNGDGTPVFGCCGNKTAGAHGNADGAPFLLEREHDAWTSLFYDRNTVLYVDPAAAPGKHTSGASSWPVATMLLIDPTIVVQAIEQESDVPIDGTAYLEKIINCSVAIPSDARKTGLISNEIIHDGEVGGAASFVSIPQNLPLWYIHHWTDDKWTALMTMKDPTMNPNQLFKEFAFLKPRQMKRILNSWIITTYMAALVDHCSVTRSVFAYTDNSMGDCIAPNSTTQYLPLIFHWIALSLAYPIQCAAMRYCTSKIGISPATYEMVVSYTRQTAANAALAQTKRENPGEAT